jgi:hypothetical protein
MEQYVDAVQRGGSGSEGVGDAKCSREVASEESAQVQRLEIGIVECASISPANSSLTLRTRHESPQGSAFSLPSRNLPS